MAEMEQPCGTINLLTFLGRLLKKIVYRFGPFSIDVTERVLRRHDLVVSAPPKVIAVLLALLSADGRVLHKQEMLDIVWPGTFVDEANLAQNVSVLRRILERDFPAQSPIETIPRLGYRFREPFETEVHSGPSIEELSPYEAESVPAVKAFGGTRMALAMVIGCAILYGMFRLWQRIHPEGAFPLVRLTYKTSANRVSASAITPDGRQIAYADPAGIVLRSTRDAQTRLLTGPKMSNVERLAWFPDGKHLVMSGTDSKGRAGIWILSAGEEAPQLFQADAGSGLPSPTGPLIAFTTQTSTEVWLISPNGRDAHRLVHGSPGETFQILTWNAAGTVLMLERHIPNLVTARDAPSTEPLQSSYMAVDVASGQLTAKQDHLRIGRACLVGDDRLLYSVTEPWESDSSSSVWMASIHPATGSLAATPKKLAYLDGSRTLSLTCSLSTHTVAMTLKRGGPGVYVGSLTEDDRKLEDVHRLSSDTNDSYPHAWTPDSKAVLFESHRPDLNRFQIFRQQVDHSDPEAILPSEADQTLPRVAPGGRWLLFSARAVLDAPHLLYRIPLSGGTPVPVEAGSPAGAYRCPASGTYCVLYETSKDKGGSFYLLDPVSGKGNRLFELPFSWGSVSDWDVSPDASTIGLILNGALEPEIRLIDLRSGQSETLRVHASANLTALNWAADRKGWFATVPTGLGTDLLYVDGQGNATTLHHTNGSTWGVPSPDGHRLSFVDQEVDSNLWLAQLDRKP